MIAVVGTRWLLEEKGQHTAQKVDVGRPRGSHLAPETRDAEALHHGERDAVLHRHDQDLAAADMIKRLPYIEHVARPEIREPGGGMGAAAEHTVGHHHAFRQPGRARREADRDHVIRLDGTGMRRAIRVVQNLREISPDARPFPPDHGGQAEAGQERIDLLRIAAIGDHELRLGMQEDVFQAISAQIDVDRHDAGAELQEAKEDDHMVRMVREHHRDAISSLDAERREAVGEPVSRPRKIGDGDHASARLGEDEIPVLRRAVIHQGANRQITAPPRANILAFHRLLLNCVLSQYNIPLRIVGSRSSAYGNRPDCGCTVLLPTEHVGPSASPTGAAFINCKGIVLSVMISCRNPFGSGRVRELMTLHFWLRVLDDTQDQLRRDGYTLSFGSDLGRGIFQTARTARWLSGNSDPQPPGLA